MLYSPEPMRAYVEGGHGPLPARRHKLGQWNLLWLALPEVDVRRGRAWRPHPIETDIDTFMTDDVGEIFVRRYPTRALDVLVAMGVHDLWLTNHWSEATLQTAYHRARIAEARLKEVVAREGNVIAVDFRAFAAA